MIADFLSTELSRCKQWLVDNKLSLHLGKTEYLLFGSSRKLKRAGDFPFLCDGIAVKQVTQVKYLGVTLDGTLSGRDHFCNLVNTCTGRLKFLYRNSRFLDQRSKHILCSSLIQPYIDYCISSWYSGLSVTLTKKLDVFQRKMVRFIHGFDYRHHVGNMELHNLTWLTIPDRALFFKMVHLFKIRHKLAPSYLTPNFSLLFDSHKHNTRGSGVNFQLTREISLSTCSFSYTAAKQWNALPLDLKETSEFRVFKKKAKEIPSLAV